MYLAHLGSAQSPYGQGCLACLEHSNEKSRTAAECLAAGHTQAHWLQLTLSVLQGVVSGVSVASRVTTVEHELLLQGTVSDATRSAQETTHVEVSAYHSHTVLSE